MNGGGGTLQNMSGHTHCWAMCGVDANRLIEFNNNHFHPAKVQLMLVGYTMPGVFFFANPWNQDIGPASYDTWQTIDLGPSGKNFVPTNTLGVIVQAYCYSSPRQWGVRMYGSSDNRTQQLSCYHCQHTWVIGCDAQQRIEAYRDQYGVRHFLIGYITDGAYFNRNAPEISPAAVGSWDALGSMPYGTEIGFIETHGIGGRFSVGGIYWQYSAYHNSCFCPHFDWRGIREYGGSHFYLTGYATGLYVPTVVTDAASQVTKVSAVLNGRLADDGGEPCDCGFEWGKDTGYGNVTPTQTRTKGETLSQEIFGLSPNAFYHFRTFAANSQGTSFGADRTFRTESELAQSYFSPSLKLLLEV